MQARAFGVLWFTDGNMTKTLKTLSKDTKRLLSGGESEEVDFKQTAKSITAEDLVAFANSDSGGAILVGVKENSENNGRQIGEVIGHPIGDAEVSQILGKAQSCHPPVGVDIQFENTSKKPIIRINIPRGEARPHCTEKGTYAVRKGNRNTGLRPQQLLAMFMETEAAAFSKRFSNAADEIKFQMIGVSHTIEDLEEVILSKIDQISWDVDNAETEAQDAASTVKEALAYAAAAHKKSKDNEVRLDALLKGLKISDPIRSAAEKKVRAAMRERLSEFSASELADFKSGKVSSSFSVENYPRYMDQDDMRRLCAEALNEILSSKENNPSNEL